MRNISKDRDHISFLSSTLSKSRGLSISGVSSVSALELCLSLLNLLLSSCLGATPETLHDLIRTNLGSESAPVWYLVTCFDHLYLPTHLRRSNSVNLIRLTRSVSCYPQFYDWHAIWYSSRYIRIQLGTSAILNRPRWGLPLFDSVPLLSRNASQRTEYTLLWVWDREVLEKRR